MVPFCLLAVELKKKKIIIFHLNSLVPSDIGAGHKMCLSTSFLL